jgi:hypothetical protein
MPHVTQQSTPINVLQKKGFLWLLSLPIGGSQSCDLFLYRRLNNHLEWRHLITFYKIQISVTDKLKGIAVETFQHCYDQ